MRSVSESFRFQHVDKRLRREVSQVARYVQVKPMGTPELRFDRPEIWALLPARILLAEAIGLLRVKDMRDRPHAPTHARARLRRMIVPQNRDRSNRPRERRDAALRGRAELHRTKARCQ